MQGMKNYNKLDSGTIILKAANNIFQWPILCILMSSCTLGRILADNHSLFQKHSSLGFQDTSGPNLSLTLLITLVALFLLPLNVGSFQGTTIFKAFLSSATWFHI